MVISLNLCLSVGLGYLAWYLWHWQKEAQRAADRVRCWAIFLKRRLRHCPQRVQEAHRNVYGTRQNYALLTIKHRQLLQGLALLVSLGQMWDQWHGKRRR